MFKRSLSLLAALTACAPDKTDTDSSSVATDVDETGDTPSTGDTPTTGDAPTTGGPETCPPVQPGAQWDIGLGWNDDGPPGFEPDPNFESELREAPCTVTAVGPAVGLACTYEGEAEPRAHDLALTLPAGSKLALAVDDAVELVYRRTSGFESPTAWHLELRRDGVTVLAATNSGGAQFAICHADVQLVEDFSEFGLALTHAACAPETRDRVDFTIAGMTTALWEGTTGPLADGFVGVIEEANHGEENGSVLCNYKVLVLLAGT